MEDLLMQKIASGDRGCFDVLFNMWSRRILAYAYRCLHNAEDAQDVVQETFLQLFKAAPSYKAEGRFAAFILKIAGNNVRMKIRRARPTESLTPLDEEEGIPLPVSLMVFPEDGVIERMDVERLLAAIPERQRQAIELSAGGLSYAEAAKEMGITTEAFAQLMLRGRRSIRALVERE